MFSTQSFCRFYEYLKYFICPWIVIDGYFKFDKDKLVNNNFGDDINFPLLENLTGKKIIAKQKSNLGRITHLLCIGSIIESCSDTQALIWGSGAIYGNIPLIKKPKTVYAVRGPLTRRYLLSQGVNCPEVYGDPALLLPLIYSPKAEKKYKLGFIPHYIDYNLPHVIKFREEHPEILFIKFERYTSWQDVIEQINSCEAIVSSSLHGLIVSDAYKIPNVRIILSDNIVGGDFKFKDYMAGVGREYKPPIDGKHSIHIEEIYSGISNYKYINFNPYLLLSTFPYTLKRDLNRK